MLDQSFRGVGLGKDNFLMERSRVLAFAIQSGRTAVYWLPVSGGSDEKAGLGWSYVGF